eukprot:6185902-Pleurochrysis_carterae.AAC.4
MEVQMTGAKALRRQATVGCASAGGTYGHASKCDQIFKLHFIHATMSMRSRHQFIPAIIVVLAALMVVHTLQSVE